MSTTNETTTMTTTMTIATRKSFGFVLASAGALSLLFGCAGVQKKDTSTAEPSDTAPSSPDDPMAVVKTKPKQPDVKISEDQRADFDKAVSVYQKLKKNGALKGADCDEAASTFRRVADQNPTLLIARHNEASVYMECGRKQEAARIEEDLARKNYAPALANLGYAASLSGDSGQAESYFTRAIQADPQIASLSARINLAQILRERARRSSGSEREKYIKDAVTHLRAVLALDGNSLQAYATLCFIYFDLKLPDAAVLIGTQAIKRADEIATGKFEDETLAETVNRDRVAGKKGKGKKEDKGEDSPKGAKEVAGHGTGWTPEMKKYIAVVHNTLGLVALNKRSYKDAIPSFKKAVELDPEQYEARLNLAAVSLRFRDYATAQEQFRAVVAAQPRNYEAIIGLGVALRGGRKFDEAEQQYMAAQKIDPSRAESYYNLGLLYQDYKGTEKPTLQKAQAYYRDYLGHANGGSAAQFRRDAEKRIKDIDELFVALEEAAKLQKEAEELQRKAEEQQKKMEEEMKRQDEAEKQKAAAPAATTPPPAGAAPAGPAGAPPSTTPPPASVAPPPAGAPPAPGKAPTPGKAPAQPAKTPAQPAKK